jgi:hypothetical protein
MQSIFSFFNKTHSSKSYIKIILLITIILISFHGITWLTSTKQLLDTPYPYYAGDLSRISYQPNSLNLRKVSESTLEKKHISINEWHGKSVPILTIGDSFSNDGAKGKNSFYQDYISTKTNLDVLNITPSSKYPDFLETVLILLHNNLLKEMNTKVIILESVERYAIDRFSSDFNWDVKVSKEEFLNIYKNAKTPKYKETGITFINNGNYKFILNSLLYNLSKKPIKRNDVYKGKLNKDFFSVKEKNTLLFYHEDVKKIPNATIEKITKLNNNLNHLALILKKHDIKLVFMPAVDKYNLYYPYITNNNLPKSSFFELLRGLKKEYYFVDTKSILQELIEDNVKDVFYADDTHWSYKASKHIVSKIDFDKLLTQNR